MYARYDHSSDEENGETLEKSAEGFNCGDLRGATLEICTSSVKDVLVWVFVLSLSVKAALE